MLMFAQDEVGHVSEELIEEVARRCKVTPLQVNEVVGYYSMLHTKPMGKYHFHHYVTPERLDSLIDDIRTSKERAN
jgi:NADH:ubiquinone oxidoreductase subunit E